ncbi:MAG: PQQ-binding-like beta-propeller repeat protein, partial [Cyclobacteriaceae bacterium]|nr:PQQ-binding-like beta-propeller repeat protein [Cyclobacteriaceae bacterium]
IAQEISSKYNNYWPQWRGPEATGVAPTGNPPIEWSETKNVKWKIEIPGKGHATPIIWEDKIFVLTAVETEKKIEKKEPEPSESTGRRRMPGLEAESVLQFVVMAINRADGAVIWEQTVRNEAPVDGTHNLGTWASNSPVTDGKYLYAYFGSRGLYCLDFDGNLLWERDFGQMVKKMSFGEGSSPALYKDKIVILWDHEGDSFLYILDKKTGKDIMRISRDEASSWSSPLIVNVNGKDQVITSATKQIRSYDLETGEIIWHDTGMTSNVIPHPMVNQGTLYLMSGFRGNAIKAIDLSKAKGNVNGTDAIVWEYNQNASYTPSALLANDKLYFLRSNNGNLTCIDAADGKENYSLEKLEGTGTVFASPVGVQDRLYISSQSGITYVVKQGSNFEILAKNELEDGNFASPAIVGDELFIRGFQYLYCLSEE